MNRICFNYFKKSTLILVILRSSYIAGASVQEVTQPIGILARTYETTGPIPFPVQPPPPSHQPYPLPVTPINEVNYICAQWDPDEYVETAPFDTNYPATEIILTEPQHFVRLLGTPNSSSNGAWIMRSEYVRGKTPDELRDIFALPVVPKEIVSVTMPASPDPKTGKNYVLWTGIAGAIRTPGFDWGDGGSVQNRLVADPPGTTNYFPTYGYTSADTRYHRQPIGKIALSYKPMAGTGNSLCMANYLDLFVPPAYSDLENVYTKLDDLNYVGYGSCPLQNALNQISPTRYDALSYIAFRNAIISGNSIFEQQLFKQWEQRWYGSCRTTTICRSKPYCWLKIIGQSNKRTSTYRYNNFGYNTGGLICCSDWQVRTDLVAGINVTALGNKFHWHNCGGNGRGGEAQLGLYVSYFPSCFFIDALLSGGFYGSSTCRTIWFEGINRQAYSHQHGNSFSAQMQTGLNILHDIIPYIRVAYTFTHEHAFHEKGAESLNLAIHNFSTNTVRVQIGAELNHVFESACYKIMPQVQCALVKDSWIKKRAIGAHLEQLGGCFVVEGMPEHPGHFVGGVGLNVLLKECLALFVRYDAEVINPKIINTAQVGMRMSF